MATVGTGYLSVIPDMRGISKKISNDLKKIEPPRLPLQTDSKSFLSSIKSAASSASNILQSASNATGAAGQTLTKYVTKPALAATTAVAGIFAGAGIKRIVAIDTAKAQMQGLGYATKDVETVMKNALAAVKGTSFGLGEAAQTAANAMAAGVKPGKELEKYLTLVGDAASIANTSMSEMGFIMNQVRTSGKAQRYELNMLAKRGIPIYQWLADAAGTSMEEINAQLEAGGVSVELFEKAIDEHIGGAAKKMGELSITAGFKNLIAAAGRAGEAFLNAGDDSDSLFNTVKRGIASATKGIDEITPKFEIAGKIVSKVIGSVKKPLKDLAKSVGDLVSTVFDAGDEGVIGRLFSDDADVRAKALSELVDNITDSIKNLTDWVNDLKSLFDDLPASTQNAIGNIAKAMPLVLVAAGPVLTVLSKILGIGASILGGVSPLIDKVAALGVTSEGAAVGIGAVAEGLLLAGVVAGLAVADFKLMYDNSENLRDSVSKLGGVFVDANDGIKQSMQSLSDVMGEFVNNIAPNVSSNFEIMGDAVSPFIDAISVLIAFLGNLTEIFIEVQTTILTILLPAFQNFSDTINNDVMPMIGAFVFTFSEVSNMISTTVIEMMNIITAVITGGLMIVRGDWDGGWAHVTQATGSSVENIKSTVRNGMDNIYNKIKNTAEKYKGTWVANMASTAVDYASKLARMVSDTRQRGSEMLAYVSSIPSKIKSYFANAGSWLVGAGSAIIGGLKQGIMNKIDEVYSYVSGIGAKIRSLKGPEEYDRKLLIPAGELIIGGLEKGIKDSIGSIYNLVATIAPTIQKQLDVTSFGNIEYTPAYAGFNAAPSNNVNIYIDGLRLSSDPEIEQHVIAIYNRLKHTEMVETRMK